MTPEEEKAEKKKKQREKAERDVAEDLTKTLSHLLVDVHDESVNADEAHSPTTRTLARFGSLLCVLSVQAEAQSKRIIKLTWALCWLTVGLFLLTGALVWLEFSK